MSLCLGAAWLSNPLEMLGNDGGRGIQALPAPAVSQGLGKAIGYCKKQ